MLISSGVCSEKLVQLHLLTGSLELSHPLDFLVREWRDACLFPAFISLELLCSSFCPKIVSVLSGEVYLLEAGRKGINPASQFSVFDRGIKTINFHSCSWLINCVNFCQLNSFLVFGLFLFLICLSYVLAWCSLSYSFLDKLIFLSCLKNSCIFFKIPFFFIYFTY